MKEKNVIIDSQTRTISDLKLETEKLKQENFKIKQNKCYACDVCDFETEEKQHLYSPKQINQQGWNNACTSVFTCCAVPPALGSWLCILNKQEAEL